MTRSGEVHTANGNVWLVNALDTHAHLLEAGIRLMDLGAFDSLGPLPESRGDRIAWVETEFVERLALYGWGYLVRQLPSRRVVGWFGLVFYDDHTAEVHFGTVPGRIGAAAVLSIARETLPILSEWCAARGCAMVVYKSTEATRAAAIFARRLGLTIIEREPSNVSHRQQPARHQEAEARTGPASAYHRRRPQRPGRRAGGA